MANGTELLGDAVYARLVDLIFTGDLQPGAPLSVPALAARLDVSRSPVRESVQRLIADGLAVHVAHAGARVAEVDEETIADVMTVRELLDGLAAREATRRADGEQIAQLRRLLEEQEALLGSAADGLVDARLDLEFHTAVRDLAGNPTLSDALHRLDTKAHLYNSGLWEDDENRRIALLEHRRIVDAIAAGDAEAAGVAAEAHVSSVLVRMRRLARRRP
ncbi:GntR family transcriptional regulator [Nocardioides sp. YIM 152588]|uniref:GntR family transcriptional regulator n=1 Tax=Nocardioides sp. YIM 152588 TaxID=3158259 RepID=UPI0032E38C2F